MQDLRADGHVDSPQMLPLPLAVVGADGVVTGAVGIEAEDPPAGQFLADFLGGVLDDGW